MDTRLVNMLKYAKIPFELNVKPGENVLIVIDTETDPLAWQALAAAGVSHGAEVSVGMMTPREAHGYEPTEPIARAMLAADHIMLCTTKALAHADVSKQCQRQGKVIYFMEEVTYDMLSQGATLEDYAEMAKLGQKVMDLWTTSNRVHITSALGTDFTASLEGRRGLYIAGKAFRNDQLQMCCCAFPDGEAVIAPVEGTGEGTVVWDTTVHSVGLLKEPMVLTIKRGVVVSIEGGYQAQQFKEILDRQNDPNSFKFPAEIAIGLNPKARITGILREDKKALGTCHLAVGTNVDFGGTVKAKVHMDGLIRKPTVVMDDVVVVKDGRPMV
ncbi:MAG: aminopeptidase [Armatimonadetes bacterium]|nr:aminopeptidase [Armatimonadota bacterium]